MKEATKRRAGRRRWAELIRFLTHTMKTSGSERVRMAAAERLSEILMLRERREIAELQAAAKITGTSTPAPADEPVEKSPAPAPSREDAQRAAEEFLEKMRRKDTDG